MIDNTEGRVGIAAYLSEGVQLSALFKHRFADFLVNEIDQQKRIAVVQDREGWKKMISQERWERQPEEKPKTNPFDSFTLPLDFVETGKKHLGEEATQKIADYVAQIKQTGKQTPFEIKVPMPEDKDERFQLHQFIREHVPFFESLTKNQCNQKAPTKKEQKDQKFEEKITGPVNHILVRTSQINFKKFLSSNQLKEDTKKHIKFLLMKRNLDSINAGITISKQLGLSHKHFQFAGTKDKRGITTQWATLQGIAKGQLEEIQKRKSWNNSIFLHDFEYVDEGLKLGDLYGNRFTVVLRLAEKLALGKNWDIAKNVQSLKQHGFINYFGLQRFGSNSFVKTHDVGKHILLNDHKEAVKKILLSCQADNAQEVEELFEQGNYQLLLQKTPYKLRVERQLLEGLIKVGQGNFLAGLQQLPRNMRELYTHAYQSYLWNRMASRRILEHGNQIVVGDLVSKSVSEAIVDDEALEIEAASGEVEVTLVTEENKGQYDISNVVLPLYGSKLNIPNGALCKRMLEELLKEEGLGEAHFEQANHNFHIDGSYRYLIAIPEAFEFECTKFEKKDEDIVDGFGEVLQNHGDLDALIVKFNLQKSSYATMMIRELCKSPSSLEFQQKINEDYLKL